MYGIKEDGRFVAAVTVDNIQSDKYLSLHWKNKDGNIACIHRLAVHPGQKGRGLGKRLLQYAENLAKEQGHTSIRIDVYQTNETAIGLYEKNGYNRVGEVRYPLRKHAYISMEKLLN